MDAGGSTDMTLAFELAALQGLSNPGRVFDGARRFSEYVGVVSAEPTYVVTNFTRAHRIRQDFFSGPQGKGESLENVRGQFDTDRHVLVSPLEDASLAADVGWEHVPLERAAEAAGWELGDPDADDRDDEGDRDDWP